MYTWELVEQKLLPSAWKTEKLATLKVNGRRQNGTFHCGKERFPAGEPRGFAGGSMTCDVWPLAPWFHVVQWFYCGFFSRVDFTRISTDLMMLIDVIECWLRQAISKVVSLLFFNISSWNFHSLCVIILVIHLPNCKAPN